MKIAMIATEKLPVPAIRGGATQIYLDATAAVMARKHDVTVLSIRDRELPDEEKNKNGVAYRRFAQETYVQEVAAHLRTETYDVIHVCNRPRWVRYIREASPDSAIVLSVHNEMFRDDKISYAEGIDCINTVKQIVTVSDYIGATICDRFPQAAGKVATVYSGVDVKTFQPKWTTQGAKINAAVRRELGLEGKKVVLFVGRLSKVKGAHLLLEALPSITEKHPEAMIVFVGSKWFGANEMNSYVRYLYTLGALYENNAMFIQFVKPEQISQLYTMADLFVCPSQWQEPLARVHYEAMAAGLPIITSNRGGNPEVVENGKNGYIINDFSNPEAYATLINKLLDEPAFASQMGKYGRQKAEREFSWEAVAAKLLRAYGEERG
ncbi:glycosyl transferase [Geobacillus sp. 46C-IIa]|uniref:glycosyltransferase family 4 protein n=1 Tax=Geobacillus sp. 46C-IIa TaxID=1963025 RepID=UPI0009BEA103|nr:glycosyltransferase family 4 protein [Geobacillus sp. 46C-IIa]OQP05576.1 glycosyl transferase [Geobacillus sp. 46C-IIa]QNU27184.1 glycosyltransferase family 4 protein [Geobacillus sp. 46C-IIa]